MLERRGREKGGVQVEEGKGRGEEREGGGGSERAGRRERGKGGEMGLAGLSCLGPWAEPWALKIS